MIQINRHAKKKFMITEKECNKCHLIKPTTEFYAYRNTFQPHCKPCSMIYIASIRKANVQAKKGFCEFNNIEKVMKLKNMEGYGIAQQIGRSPALFYSYMRNETQPTIRALFAIADVLNCKPTDLINDAAQDVDKIHSEKYVIKEAFARFPIIYTNKKENDLNFKHRVNWIDGYNAALNAFKI
jgi:transcriptional regulator with XRE-family HTH domain